MSSGSEWLKEVAERMTSAIANGAAPTPEKISVRDLITKFGYVKRGDHINGQIRNELEKNKLRTDRDLAVGWIDSVVTVQLDSDIPALQTPHITPDPTYRIGSLEAANSPPQSVKPNNPLTTATTIMQLHDYSQLPVMESEWKVLGMVSWKSIGARLSMGKGCESVKDCMEDPIELSDSTPLFEAISSIAEYGYVLVRSSQNKVIGIVTATDLSLQFRQLAGPFLFVGEIEGYLRQLIHGKFTIEEMSAASASEEGKSIEGSGDLTLGGYCRLLEGEKNWDRLGLAVDRTEFVKHLHAVREIRNDVMHFSPDGLSEDQTNKLRDMARFFENLVEIGVI